MKHVTRMQDAKIGGKSKKMLFIIIQNRHFQKLKKNLSRDPNNFRYKQLKVIEVFALFRVRENFDLMSQVLHFRNNNATRGYISK